MAVVEAGTDKAALQVKEFVAVGAAGKQLLRRAGSGKAAVLHDEGLRQRQRAGEYPAAVIDRFHMYSLLFGAVWLYLHYSGWRKEVKYKPKNTKAEDSQRKIEKSSEKHVLFSQKVLIFFKKVCKISKVLL